jgi:hypothetical protein
VARQTTKRGITRHGLRCVKKDVPPDAEVEKQ